MLHTTVMFARCLKRLQYLCVDFCYENMKLFIYIDNATCEFDAIPSPGM